MKYKKGIQIQRIKAGLPLYSRIETILRNKIENSQLMPGEKLPSEDQLASQYGVSKITIRTALSRLEADGLILRTRGKGTFVADHIPVGSQSFLSINDVYDLVGDAARYDVKPVGIETIKIFEARYPQDIEKFFQFGGNEVEISVLKRVRLLNGTPISFLENYMPEEIARRLTVEDLEHGSILKTLKERVGLEVTKGEFYIEAIPAEPDLADILNTELFEPLISIKIYYWIANDKPFEIVNCFMRADHFRYKGEIEGNL